MRRILKAAAVAVLVVLVAPVVGFYEYAMVTSVPPFPGYNHPERHVDRLRDTPEIDRFYETYGAYGVEAEWESSGWSGMVFRSQDGERGVKLSVAYLMGLPMRFSHSCAEYSGIPDEPGKKIFAEGTVSMDCFGAP